jgi:hypothetical protein
MYLHQVLSQPDAREFVEAVIKKVNGHINNDHWKLIPSTEVPGGTEVLPSVWAMQCKQDLTTGWGTKHKARLNLHGGKQEFGTNYYETYTPVVTWFAIQLLIVFGILFHLDLCQVILLWPIHKPLSRWTITGTSQQAFTPSMGIPRITSSSYLPASTGKSKLAAYGTITLSPSYGGSTSSSLLLTIASSTRMMSFSLSKSTMESSWDCQTSSHVASSMSYRTSSCPLKIKATLQIMLGLISRNSRMASLNCHNEP